MKNDIFNFAFCNKIKTTFVRNLSKCAFFLFLTFNFITLLTFNLGAQGLTKYGQSTVTGSNFVDKNGKIVGSPALNKNGQVFLVVGSAYQGGIIAYILQPGDPGYNESETRGLIAAPSDQSDLSTGLIQWYNGIYTTTGATATALGTGNANTNTIVTNQGVGSYAAQLCADLVLGGYSDWYLPSIDELNKLYSNKVAIGGFASDFYWSSTENDNHEAREQHFGTGGQNSFYKANTYYVRAVRSFPSVPTVTTATVNSITSTAANSGGNVASDGGSAITARGVCWSASTNPSIADSKTTDGTGTGAFTSSITGLTLGNTYHVRAYATNSIGTAYGNEIIFMALAIGDSYQGGIVAYILQSGDPGYNASETHGLIAAPSDQSYSTTWGCDGSAISGADGTALGTGNQNTIDIMAGCATAGIAARLCGDLVLNGYSDWYLPSQDELNKLRQSMTAIGNFSGNYYWSSSEYVNMVAYYQVFTEGFTNQNYDWKSTTHAVRAVRAFPSVPTVTTATVSSITSAAANSGGDIASDGGSTVSARGVCWSTSVNPTVALTTKTTDGTGTGVFTSSITGLTLGNTYYVRAYATNSIGTAYGNEVSFTTGIGASYQGGIIAYILQSGDPGYDAGVTHGLIAAPSDQSTGIAWWNQTFTTTGATATAIGTGNANTNTIVTNQGAGSYAAQLCADLVLDGYGDWYLPSKDELNLLYSQKATVGGFSSVNYWSSTEYNSNYAWMQFFRNGDKSYYDKYNTYIYVRAIRTF